MEPILLWDASALTKQYAPESGSETVNALFTAGSAVQHVGTVMGYAETYSALVRKHNRGEIGMAAFLTAKSALRSEIALASAFTLLSVDDSAVFDGLSYIEAHNINATDAAILAVFLRYVNALPPGASQSVVIAADQRLIQAAQAEGLVTLNPELVPAVDVPAFLDSLG